MFVVLVACGGGTKPTETTPAPAKSKCAYVADHLVSMLSEEARRDTGNVDTMRRIFHQRCSEDGWSAQVQDCFLAVTQIEDGERCAKLLTPEQERAINQAVAPAAPSMVKSLVPTVLSSTVWFFVGASMTST